MAWAVLVGVLVAALTPVRGDGQGPASGARARETGPEGSRDQE
ncbi:hypothetical protein ACIGEZ_18950 [Streptomyces sp. NPDC085481]